MLIPRYWARAKGIAELGFASHRLIAWGCSPTSQEDAQADAQARLAAWIRRVEGGRELERHYTYGRSLIREELLQEIPGPDGGETIAIVTRNRYGCQVLNAARTLFLDVDLPEDKLSGRIMSLFRGKSAPLEEQVLEKIRQALATVPGGSFRLYRTAAGFRVLGTDRLYGPADPTTVALMEAAGTDKAFITLCRVQDCFRARLEPKPWRVGLRALAWLFPYRNPKAKAAAEAWVDRFEAAAVRFSTCRFLEAWGPERMHPEVEPVLTLHDRATRCMSGLPLA